MVSSHPEFEGPRTRGRQVPRSAPPQQTQAQLAETFDRLPQTPAPVVHVPQAYGVRAPMPAMYAPALAMPVREESSPSVDGMWIVPTPPHVAVTSRGRASAANDGFKITLSFLAAALTAIAALVVMVGAVIFVRTDTKSGAQAADQTEAPEPAVDAIPTAVPAPPQQPVAVVTNVAPTQASGGMANANTRGDQTAALPPTAMAAAPPAVDPTLAKTDAPKSDKPAAKKRKRTAPAAAVKPVPTDEDGEEEETPAPKTAAKKPAPKTGDKDVEKVLADLQEQQLRR